jgi:energy-coupling factor transporter ATP-binding protein EcfA2
MLGLEHYLERKPGQLSGGERQRVAMGRAIVRVPSVFLMDEPLSNLDAKLRVQMRADIAALQLEFGVTTVYVTHDQAEAMTLGHRVAVLATGAPAVRDASRAVRPADEHVRRRLHRLPDDEPLPRAAGDERRNRARRDEGRDRRRSRGRGALERARGPRLGLRPESLEVGQNGLPARVEVVEELGADAYVFCGREVGGEELKLVARTKARDVPQRGARVALNPRPNEAHLFDSGHRRAAGAEVSAPTARGETFLAEIREQPKALPAPRRARARVRGGGAAAIERGPHIVRLVGHGSSDNAASYGVYAFGLAAGWTALRDSISLSVYYGAKLDLERSIVVALSQSGRTPDVVAYVQRRPRTRRAHDRVTNEPSPSSPRAD